MTAANTTDLAPRPPQAPATKPATTLFEGFEGAAIAPFDDWARAILAEPVDPRDVEIRPDGIVYLSGVWYRRQLIRAFGAGGWTLLPRSAPQKQGEMVVYHGALVVLGRFVSEAIGECETRRGMSYASALEGARTDCLTRCCKDLGMATELWDRTWRDAWKKDCAHIDGVDDKGKPKWWKNGGSEHDMVPLFVPSAGAAPPAQVPSGGGVSQAPATTPKAPLMPASPPPAGIPAKKGRTKGDYLPGDQVPAKKGWPAVTKEQLAEIHILRERIGWDDGEFDATAKSTERWPTYRKAIGAYRDVDGKRCISSKALQEHQADNLLRRMRAQSIRNEDRRAAMDAQTPENVGALGGPKPEPDNVINLRDAMNERLAAADEDEFLMALGFESRDQIPKELAGDVFQVLLDPSKRDQVLEKWRVLGWR